MQNFDKSLRIRFNTTDGFVRDYDRTRYLVLFGGEKYDFIYNRIRYLIGVKSGITILFLIIMQKFKRKINTYHNGYYSQEIWKLLPTSIFKRV